MKVYVCADPFPRPIEPSVEVSAVQEFEKTAKEFIKELSQIKNERSIQADKDFPIVWRKCFDLMKIEAVKGDHDALLTKKHIPETIDWTNELIDLMVERLNVHGFKANRSISNNDSIYIQWTV